MTDFDPEKFINRDEEISRVLRRVSDLVSGKPLAPKERVFHFVGPSGIGKSCLLEKIRLDLEHKHPECVPLLIKLDGLKEGNRGLSVELLVKVYEGFCTYTNIATNPVLKEPLKSTREYASMIARAISLREDLVPVLLLDEINIPSQTEIQEVEEYLLAKFINANPMGFLITAGRSHPMFFDFALRSEPRNTYHLPVFDEEKTGEQMQSLKPGSKGLAKKLYKLGNGVPGNTVKLVKHIVGDPPGIPETQAIRSLLDDMKKTNAIEEPYISMLEALSILQGFFPEDAAPLFQVHPQLGAGWDERRVKGELMKLKEIQVGPGGVVDWDREKKYWVMDERTRDLFERELQMRNPPELWRKLHCTALKMYREWGEKYDSDVYRGKSVHHQSCLQSAGMDCRDLEG
jgi:hypothetical protein